MKIPKLVLPKEHGLWVWTLMPFCVGAGSARGDAGGFWLTLAALFFWFMAVTPARMIYKGSKKDAMQNRLALFWCAVYSAIGTAATIGSVLVNMNIAFFFAVAAIAFYVAVRASYSGRHRGFFFEFGGIIFLSLGSFMGAYSVTGSFESIHLAVWVFTIIFLMDRNSQTRIVVRSILPYRNAPFPAEELKLVYRINLFISLLSIIAVSAALGFFMVHKVFLAPYAPGILLTFYFFQKPPPTLRVIGYSELTLALLFGVGFILLSDRLY